MRYYIGTSGYHYDDWKEKFYPKDLPKNQWLEYYCQHFETLEINNTFYNIPKKETFEDWYKDTPSKFKFSVKGSRYVTHMKKLNDPKEGTTNFYKAIEPLKEKIDCVLWQLPGNFHFNKEKLENFAKACSKDYINVLEFRHPSWFADESLEVLAKHKLSYCMISAPDDLPEITPKTNATGYLRFHGKNEWYQHKYSKKELQKWVRKLDEMKPNRVFVYFNNDQNAHSVKNARQLQEIVRD